MIIDKKLLLAVRKTGRCQWCGRSGPTDAAHVFTRGMGGGSRLDIRINLVALCRQCHDDHHRGERPIDCDLLALSAATEGLTTQEARGVIWLLRAVPNRATESRIRETVGRFRLNLAQMAYVERLLKAVAGD